ncbi:MAG: hypothetical protein R3B90_09825 [Planctomycetaceae bacterium]
MEQLLQRVTCPHCWQKFPPEEILWIAEHNDLLGDSMLSDADPQRFLPTRFNVDGNAIDAKNFICSQLACPKCHLPVPRAALELEPVFMSITGAPASGKSVYLAAMVWELRRILGTTYSLAFTDSDTLTNQKLNSYEERLFMNPDADELTPLGSLIEKTDAATTGEMYNSVRYGNQTVDYPRPFLFTVLPNHTHPHADKASQLGRLLTLYDNAGEHFQPGMDSSGSPVTRHMAEAASLMYVFDPTMDSRFRELCQARPELRQTSGRDSYSIRQEPVLQEVASRVRRHGRLRQSERHKKPLIVILTKYDLWYDLLEVDDNTEPWKEVATKPGDSSEKRFALDIPRIEAKSQETRKLLLRVSPEIVNSAEGFAEEVLYVPVSSLGWATTVDSQGMLSIRPADVYPFWVTVPILYSFSRCLKGLVPVIRKKS